MFGVEPSGLPAAAGAVCRWSAFLHLRAKPELRHDPSSCFVRFPCERGEGGEETGLAAEPALCSEVR